MNKIKIKIRVLFYARVCEYVRILGFEHFIKFVLPFQDVENLLRVISFIELVFRQ